MKYVLLVYQDEKKLDAVPESELDALISDCIAWVAELEKGGHHIFSAGLQSVRSATTVRNRRGQPTVTDGPFAETKEQLGGFTLINARDLNQAIQLAAKLPAARLGAVEVRPLLETGHNVEADVPLTSAFDQKIAAAMRRQAGK